MGWRMGKMDNKEGMMVELMEGEMEEVKERLSR